jgi:hypothetical protein
MTSKFIKVSSLQGVSTVQDNQLIDFIIPPNSYYNLANSYLSFLAKLNTTENTTFDTTNKKGIHAVSCEGYDNIPYRNNVLIRDYRLTSDKVIDIENLQESNVINVNMDVYARDFEQIKSEQYQSLCSGFKDPTFTVDNDATVGNFRTLSKSGASTEDVMEVKIPLNSVSSFCNTTLYDTNRFGRSQLKIQIDSSKIWIYEYNPYPITDEYHGANNLTNAGNVLTTTGFANFLQSWHIRPSQTIQITFSAGNPLVHYVVERNVDAVHYDAGTFTTTVDGDELPVSTDISYWKVALRLECENVPTNTGAAVQISNLTTTEPFTDADVDDLKQFIGRPITIACAGCDAINPYIDCVLKNVESLTDYKKISKVKLTFDPPFTQANGEALTDVRICILEPSKLNCTDIPNPGAGGASITTYTIPNLQLQNCKLWVGCKVYVRGTFPANNNGYYTTVKELRQNGANVEVVVNDAFQLANEQTITNIRLQVVNTGTNYPLEGITGLPVINVGTSSLELYNPTMVLHELFPTHKMVKEYVSHSNKELEYSYWKPELINIPTGTKNFVRLFQVDGSCRNAFAIIKKSDNLLSVADNLATYRWRINNYDKTLRDIPVDSSLEQDNVMATINNSDIVGLKSFQSLQKKYGRLDDFVVIPMTTVPMDGQPKTLMLTLNYDTETLSDKLLYLVKECTTVIKV